MMNINIQQNSLRFNFNFKTHNDKKYFRKEFHYLIINTALLLIGGVESNPGPKKCNYKDCEKIPGSSSNIKYHRISIPRRKRWLLNSGHDKNSPLSALSDKLLRNRYICSKHFLPEHYNTAEKNRTRLLDGIDPIPYKSLKIETTSANNNIKNRIYEVKIKKSKNIDMVEEDETNLAERIELPCLFCDFRGEATSVHEHISSSHNYCRICNILYESESAFHEHVKNHAAGLIYFKQCNFCLDGFRETDDVEAHLISEHSKLLFKKCYESGNLYLDKGYNKVFKTIPEVRIESMRNISQCPYCHYNILKSFREDLVVTREYHLSKLHNVIKCKRCEIFFKIQDIIENGLCNFCLQLPNNEVQVLNNDVNNIEESSESSSLNIIQEGPSSSTSSVIYINSEDVEPENEISQNIKCETIDTDIENDESESEHHVTINGTVFSVLVKSEK